jgi:hypothetical protein
MANDELFLADLWRRVQQVHPEMPTPDRFEVFANSGTDRKRWGYCREVSGYITVGINRATLRHPAEHLLATMLHEATHATLYAAGDFDHEHGERFMQRAQSFGCALFDFGDGRGWTCELAALGERILADVLAWLRLEQLTIA